MLSAERARGFTLVEVLVALLLVSLALAALVRTAGTGARNLATLQEATVAQWVAANVIAETRLQRSLPPLGRSDGRVAMGGWQWRWRLDVQGTDLPEVRRLDVQVFVDDGDGSLQSDATQSAARLTGFASTP